MKVSSGTLLSLSTGIYCAPSMGEMHEAMEILVGHPVFTHQMPELAMEIRELVIRKFPWLEGIEVPEGPDCVKVVQAVNAQYGKMHDL